MDTLPLAPAGPATQPIRRSLSRPLLVIAPPPTNDDQAAELHRRLLSVAQRAAEARKPAPEEPARAPVLPPPLALPVAPGPTDDWPTAEALVDWLRQGGDGAAGGAVQGGEWPALLLLALIPLGSTGMREPSKLLKLAQELQGRGFRVSCLPLLVALDWRALKAAGQQWRVYLGQLPPGLLLEALVIVSAVLGGQALGAEALATEAHLIAWQLSRLTPHERATAFRRGGNGAGERVVLARGRFLIHPATVVWEVAGARLAARALSETLGRSTLESTAEQEARGQQLAAAALAALDATALEQAAAPAQAAVVGGLLRPLAAPRLTLAERSDALDGLYAQLASLEAQGARGEGDSPQAVRRRFVDAAAQQLRADLLEAMVDGLQRGGGWASMQATLRAARRALQAANAIQRGDLPPAPALAWPERPGQALQGLSTSRPPAVATLLLAGLLAVGAAWTVGGLGAIAVAAGPGPASASAPTLPGTLAGRWLFNWPLALAAALLGILTLLAALHLEAAGREAKQRRWLEALRRALDRWAAESSTWAARELVPRRLAQALDEAQGRLDTGQGRWEQALTERRQRAATLTRDGARPGQPELSLLGASRLAAAARATVREVSVAAAAARAIELLAAPADVEASGRGSTFLEQPAALIGRRHDAAAAERLQPLRGALLRLFDATLRQEWPTVATALTLQAQRLAGQGGDAALWLFQPAQALGGEVLVAAATPTILTPDGELSTLALLRPAAPERQQGALASLPLPAPADLLAPFAAGREGVA